MTKESFAELTKQVYLLNDLILSDMVCGSVDYSEEFLNFSRHLFATKFWFLRIAWPNKRRYILSLMEDVKSAWTLSLLLKSLWNCRPKDAILSVGAKVHPWSVYDQVPMDHNRTALPISTLAQMMTNDRKWFHTLDVESQALVLSELLTIAGGPVMWEVLHRGQIIYERHREQQLRDLLECVVVDHDPKVASPQAKDVATNTTVGTPNKPDPESTAENTQQKVESPEMLAAQKRLDDCLNSWNNIIKDIQRNQKLEEVEMIFKDGTMRKIWKVNRVKPGDFETVDFVQLLPSAVGKRILSYLPQANLADYARVNKYWAYLVEEYRLERAAKSKLVSDTQKLQDVMLLHDVSLDAIVSTPMEVIIPSMATSIAPSSRKLLQSYKQSERSAGVVSFRRMVVDKLKPSYKMKPKPIKRLKDLTERLERRGAADENLWQWCKNVLRYYKGRYPEAKPVEGVIVCSDVHFPCPLMKHSLELPLSKLLSNDPAHPVIGQKARRNFTYPPVVEPSHEQKRYSLWSRNFSSLYRVLKVASYQSPV